MNKTNILIGLGILAGTCAFDYFIWSSLIASITIGAIIGFGILALIFIPITFFGLWIGLAFIFAR